MGRPNRTNSADVMIRSVAGARLLLILLTLAVALWLAAAGTVAAFIPRTLVAGFNDSLVVSVVVVLLLIWLTDAIFVPRLIAIARNAQWYAAPVVGTVQLFGAAGL